MTVSRFRWKFALFWGVVFPISVGIGVVTGAVLGSFITGFLGLGRPF